MFKQKIFPEYLVQTLDGHCWFLIIIFECYTLFSFVLHMKHTNIVFYTAPSDRTYKHELCLDYTFKISQKQNYMN